MRRWCNIDALFPVKVCMKWAYQVQWECLGLKGRKETLGVQEFLLQVFLEKKVSLVPQVRCIILCPSLNN